MRRIAAPDAERGRLAIRDLATREAIDRYGDRFDIVLVDLGSHHFPVEAPEATAKLLAGVMAGQTTHSCNLYWAFGGAAQCAGPPLTPQGRCASLRGPLTREPLRPLGGPLRGQARACPSCARRHRRLA